MQSNRRKFVTTLAGVGASLSIAGCSGTEDGTPADGGDSMGNESMTEGESMDDGSPMTEGGSVDDGDSMDDDSPTNESMTDSMN